MAGIGGLSLEQYLLERSRNIFEKNDSAIYKEALRLNIFFKEFHELTSLLQRRLSESEGMKVTSPEDPKLGGSELKVIDLSLPKEVASISVDNFVAQMAVLCKKAKEAIKNHATNARKAIDAKLSSPVQHSEAFTESINNIESNASKVLGSIDKVLKEEHLTDAHKKECLELPGLIAGKARDQMTHEVTCFLNPPLNQNQNGNVTAKEEDVFQKIVELYDELLELDENQSLTPEKIMSSIKQMRDILQDSKNNSHTMAGSPYTIQAPKSSASASRPQTPNHQNARASGG